MLVCGSGRFLSLLTYLGMHNLSDHLSREFVLRLVQYWTKGLHTPSFIYFPLLFLSFPPLSSSLSFLNFSYSLNWHFIISKAFENIWYKWWHENSNIRQILHGQEHLQSQKSTSPGLHLDLLRPFLLALSVSFSLQSSFSDRPFRQGPGFLIAIWNKGCRLTLCLSLFNRQAAMCWIFCPVSIPLQTFPAKNLNSRFCLIMRAHRHCCCRFYSICSCLIWLRKHVLNACTNYCKAVAAADLSNLCKYCSLMKMKCVWKSFNLGRKSNQEF